MTQNDTILLVEDSEDDAFLFRRAVERSGCQADVCHCPTAGAAMDHLESLRTSENPLPALIFVDLLLPEVRGTDLVIWLKQHAKYLAIPVIVITGSAPPQTATDLAALGANAVMLKPPTAARLVECIAAACTFWLNCCLRP
jgi:CheY-like chemotaxis protein